jgi:hypothetical protein
MLIEAVACLSENMENPNSSRESFSDTVDLILELDDCWGEVQPQKEIQGGLVQKVLIGRHGGHPDVIDVPREGGVYAAHFSFSFHSCQIISRLPIFHICRQWKFDRDRFL